MDPEAEAKRLQRLHDMGILDSPENRLFRGFAEQALVLLPGTSFAAVSLIDADRQWFKTIIGLDEKETPRSVSFCTHTIETPGMMVVEDATQDSRFAANPLVVSAVHPLLRRHQADRRRGRSLRSGPAASAGDDVGNLQAQQAGAIRGYPAARAWRAVQPSGCVVTGRFMTS
jgi:hypothetical protein